MSAEEIEMKLLEEYCDAASQAEDPKDLAQKIALYEKQLLVCKGLTSDFNVAWAESMVYYLKARHKLLSQGFMEGASRTAVRQSSGFEVILPVLLAKGGENSRMHEAISLLTQAINIYEDPDYRYMRANLYSAVKNKRAALEDVEYLLKTYGDDQEVYMTMRKLKDEIETSQDKRCFVATAVYEPTEIAKIDLLRSYRDRVLLKSVVGRGFVSVYYATSPSIAKVISKSQSLKVAIKTLLLDPIVKLVADFMNKN